MKRVICGREREVEEGSLYDGVAISGNEILMDGELRMLQSILACTSIKQLRIYGGRVHESFMRRLPHNIIFSGEASPALLLDPAIIADNHRVHIADCDICLESCDDLVKIIGFCVENDLPYFHTSDLTKLWICKGDRSCLLEFNVFNFDDFPNRLRSMSLILGENQTELTFKADSLPVEYITDQDGTIYLLGRSFLRLINEPSRRYDGETDQIVRGIVKLIGDTLRWGITLGNPLDNLAGELKSVINSIDWENTDISFNTLYTILNMYVSSSNKSTYISAIRRIIPRDVFKKAIFEHKAALREVCKDDRQEEFWVQFMDGCTDLHVIEGLWLRKFNVHDVNAFIQLYLQDYDINLITL